jgi:Putative esterase
MVLGVILVPLYIFSQKDSAGNTASNERNAASDDFNRGNGSLGPGWTDMSDHRMAISSHALTGTSASGISGGMRASNAFTSDQYSQVEVTSTQLTGGQWIGSAVRAQDGGLNAYLGIYWWNSGSPELKLYLRHAGNFTPIGSVYDSGPLASATKLELMAVGNTISLLENGIQRISVADSTLSRGVPGTMAYGTAQADNWSGGNADGFQVSYLSTNTQGIKSYNMISDNNGYGSQILRVLPPAKPAPGVAHNFLVVLRVGAGLGSTYGNGLQTMQALDAQDRYNLTIIEPTFTFDPWYADNPGNRYFRYETFMAQDLVPWIKRNLATTSKEQVWLVGFSKSGLGAQDLLLKHPGVFTLAASWDFPADMSSYNQIGGGSANYGTDANFQANYRLTAEFAKAHKAPFLTDNRIWIGGYQVFKKHISDYNALLTSNGIAHTMETPQPMAHRWNSGWIPIALAALYQDSMKLRRKS